jgi:hypothetical protein
VNLEVIVPRIILPVPSLNRDEVDDEMEQAHLSEIETAGTSSPTGHSREQSPPGEATTSATYTTRQGPFRLFSINHVQAYGQTLLLQVLRCWRRGNQGQGGNPGQQEYVRVTDELAFTVEARGAVQPSEAMERTPLPGLTRVVIFLDEENVPNRYSIDGAER